MNRADYDRLIADEHICRIAFRGKDHPHIAPFIYVFDGRFMYFLSSRYGRKIDHFREDPRVSVEVERYARDLSSFCFVTLRGRLAEVHDASEARRVREMFISLIKGRKISQNILIALGHRPDEPLEALFTEERNLIWKLVGVKEIVGLQGADVSLTSNPKS